MAPFRSENPQITLLQYVDDLLLAAVTEQKCKLGTERLLTELGELGYRALAKKAQICQTEVTYLGYTLKEGKRWLTEARKKDCNLDPYPYYPKTSERISWL